MKKVKGYKVFNPDWTCRGFKYEIGKTYIHEGNIDLCKEGFHFCEKLVDCFNYYDFNPDNKVAEVVATDKVVKGEDKSVTNYIKIVRELSWNDVLNLVNTGKGNTGCGNSGDWNSGNWNSGNSNSGDWNSGNSNSGNWNSGLFNACNHANGLFNSKAPKIYMFNKPTKLTFEEFQEKHYEAYELLYCSSFRLTEWIPDYNMPEEEKDAHPEYKVQEGYLRTYTYKEACQKMWEDFTEADKDKIKKLPNFDKDIFKEITGIEV